MVVTIWLGDVEFSDPGWLMLLLSLREICGDFGDSL